MAKFCFCNSLTNSQRSSVPDWQVTAPRDQVLGCPWSCHLVCTCERGIALVPVQARQLLLGASSPLIHQLITGGCGWKGWWWCCSWEVECEIYSEIQYCLGTRLGCVYRLLAKKKKKFHKHWRLGIVHPSEENVEFSQKQSSRPCLGLLRLDLLSWYEGADVSSVS